MASDPTVELLQQLSSYSRKHHANGFGGRTCIRIDYIRIDYIRIDYIRIDYIRIDSQMLKIKNCVFPVIWPLVRADAQLGGRMAGLNKSNAYSD